MPSSTNIRDSRRRPAKAKVGAGTVGVSLLVAGGLLILPMLALRGLPLDVRWIGGYAVAINVLAFWMYALDKSRAEAGEWRIPEAQLHLLELLGGWPAAWIAQRSLRHKTSKRSYQLVFWLIVFVHQFAAFDSLQEWKLSRLGWKSIQGLSQRAK